MNFQDQILAQNDLIKELQNENKQLKEDLTRSEAMEDYWRIHSEELNEDLQKENEKLKESKEHFENMYNKTYDIFRQYKQENEQLKKRIKDFVSENTRLQNALYTDQLQTDEADDKIEQLKNEIINLKTEIVDHRIKEYRLMKILNETDLT